MINADALKNASKVRLLNEKKFTFEINIGELRKRMK